MGKNTETLIGSSFVAGGGAVFAAFQCGGGFWICLLAVVIASLIVWLYWEFGWWPFVA